LVGRVQAEVPAGTFLAPIDLPAGSSGLLVAEISLGNFSLRKILPRP
jgi:hypothetical protein